jgi:hypothetical protein
MGEAMGGLNVQAAGHYGTKVHAGNWALGTTTAWSGQPVPKRALCGYKPWGRAYRTDRPVTCARCLLLLERRTEADNAA